MDKFYATPLIDFSGVKFDYDPFPVGIVCPAVAPDLYEGLVNGFPDIALFKHRKRLGNKFSLSERNNPELYESFVRSSAAYREFRRWIKSPDFIFGTMDMLRHHSIDLGWRRKNFTPWRRLRSVLGNFRRGRLPGGLPHFTARFELSALSSDGGCLEPHTDAPQKLITLVITLAREGEWPSAYGGGTTMMRPKKTGDSFNWMNRQIPFEDVEPFHTYEFRPNQCMIFVKTFNSLHGVEPLKGPPGSDTLRKTLTINIERHPL